MITIGLLHPSRGRPHFAMHTMHEWLAKADNPEQIQYVLGLDFDDDSVQDYYTQVADVAPLLRYGCGRVDLYKNSNKNLIDCVNKLPFALVDSVLLIVVTNDDLGCPKHWDSLLYNEIRGLDPWTDVRFIGVWDQRIMDPKGQNTEHDAYWGNMFVTRAWFTVHQYLYWKEYEGPFADFDHTGYVRSMDMTYGTKIEINAKHLCFPHRSSPIAQKDETNRRLHAPETLRRGKELLNRRIARAFDVIHSPARPL